MATLKEIKNIEDLGINRDLVHEQILKSIYINGVQKGKEISNELKVPFAIIEPELELLKKREHIVIVGASSITSGYHSWILTLPKKGESDPRKFLKFVPM